MIQNILNSRRGSGMVIAFFVLLLLTVLGTSFIVITWSSLVTARRETLTARALACAEAGVADAISHLMTYGATPADKGLYRTNHPSSDPNDHTADTGQVIKDLAPGERYVVCVRNGTPGTITQGKVIVTSWGTATEWGRTTTESLIVVVDVNRENVNVWNNVIFGGVGMAGRSINGNVAIRGSVHLLGDGESFTDLDGDGHWDPQKEPVTIDVDGDGVYDEADGDVYADLDGDGHWDPATEPFRDVNGNGTRDPALTVTDMTSEILGTAAMANSYLGMPLDLRAAVPAPPTEVFGGETVETLDAKLRVKHGKVNISGSACVGYPNSPGDSLKETVNGTYVSDGFGGSQGTASVYSDNGTTHGYDLGEGLVTMPIIDSDPYLDSVTGITYPSYLAYLKANGTVHIGDVWVTKGIPMSITGPKGSLTIDAAGDMTISGIVYVEGNIHFGPSKARIYYEGSGTLVTPFSTDVHCDLMPKTNFPLNDALGLICGDQIRLATGSGDAQLTMALAMYAQHKVISAKQSNIAGTIVSSYYEMSNVPSIYQIPELANHLPPGLPGRDPIWVVSIDVESWKRYNPPG